MTNTQKRQQIEQAIAAKLIDDALTNGYSITVNDGEEDVLEASVDKEDILAAMFSTDEDILYIFDNDKRLGFIMFVYGNDGHDVICDYTANANMEALIKGADELANKYAAQS